MGRLHFELAEPGTDPTRIPNSATGKRSFRVGDYWIILVVVAFLAFGYLRFVRKPVKANTPSPTATATATPTPEADGSDDGGFFGGGGDNPAANFARGFFPAEDTPTTTPSPTATPTATPEPDGSDDGAVAVVYELEHGGQRIVCWCYTEDGEMVVNGPPECAAEVPVACGGSDEQAR